MRTARILSEAPKDTVVPFVSALERDHAVEVVEHFPAALAASVLAELEEGAHDLLRLMMRPEKTADLVQHLAEEQTDAFSACCRRTSGNGRDPRELPSGQLRRCHVAQPSRRGAGCPPGCTR